MSRLRDLVRRRDSLAERIQVLGFVVARGLDTPNALIAELEQALKELKPVLYEIEDIEAKGSPNTP